MKAFATFMIFSCALLGAPAQAESWTRIEDTDQAFWDADARLEVDLDSVRAVDVADAKDADGNALAGPFYVATRRAVLSASAQESMRYDSEIAAEYYSCAGAEPLRTVNGSVLAAEIAGGKQKIKYQGGPGETYLFGPAQTGWQSNLQALVCARAKSTS